jgi:hypothetical protein
LIENAMGAARLLDGTGSLPAHLAGQAHCRGNEISPSRRLQSADRSLTGHWPENGTNPKFAAAMQNASNIGPATGGTLPQIAGCGPIVRRQLFLRIDDNYFSLSTTTTL